MVVQNSFCCFYPRKQGRIQPSMGYVSVFSGKVYGPIRVIKEFAVHLVLKINMTLQAAVDLSFSAIALDAASLGKSYGSQINRKSCFENLWSGAFRNRGRIDPRGVPWDQNFGHKNFLISPSIDVILCIFEVCFAKHAENHEYKVIFHVFDCYQERGQKLPYIHDFQHFLQNKLQKCIK